LSKSGPDIALSPVRIYIEGDGKPFINRTSVARDPTPRHAPVLALWELDSGDAVYIGRPCYLGLAELPECNKRLWTIGRYNGKIVESMQIVAERYSGGRPMVIIGHSGGGALAMLIADRMSRASSSEIAAVVTLSGNLDVSSWTRLHGYTPLHQSDNPAEKLPLAEHIMQLHIVAGRDSKIPPSLTRKLANRLPDNSICEVPAYDHNCCWNHRWVEFLGALETHLLSGETDPQPVCSVF
jgi:pimeloyl-ACP methyl ester carboxylesterase